MQVEKKNQITLNMTPAKFLLWKQTSISVISFVDGVGVVYNQYSLSTAAYFLWSLISRLWASAAVQPEISDNHFSEVIIKLFVLISLTQQL